MDLARFIATLAHEDNGIGDYVANYLAADDLTECVARLERTLAQIRQGERNYDRRHALDEVWLRRLDHLLDMIELVVLPRNPGAAFRLLTEIMEADADIENLLNEAWTMPTFERACALFRRAGIALPQTEVDATVARLVAKDDFGHRVALR